MTTDYNTLMITVITSLLNKLEKDAITTIEKALIMHYLSRNYAKDIDTTIKEVKQQLMLQYSAQIDEEILKFKQTYLST